MPFPRQLAPTADKSDLTAWLTEWSLFYPFDYDDQLPAASGSFGLAALRSIVSWKSEKRFKASNDVKIVNYNTVNPGLIVAITGAALAAATDGAALAALLGIPVAQGPAFGSAVLMAGDPNRWTVFDRMANTSLRKMSAVLAPQAAGGPLQRVALALAALPIPAGNVAVAANWPAYMKCCREISAITWLSLRTVDRALYEARGR